MLDSKVINVNEIYINKKKELFDKINNFKKNTGIAPVLGVVLVGNSLESQSYIRSKKKYCEDIGIGFKLFNLPYNIQQSELINVVLKINTDPNVNGFIVQLPLPRHINTNEILNHINYLKDIDGLSPINIGRLCLGNPLYIPCTAKGIFAIIDFIKYDLTGKNVGIIGRSNIVGKPCSFLALMRNATVTICHSYTKELEEICKNMDVLIVAVGIPRFIKPNYLKKNSIVIDVGINRDKLTNKLVGDVDITSTLYSVIDKITPVPKGVGLMTVTSLIENFIQCLEITVGRSDF